MVSYYIFPLRKYIYLTESKNFLHYSLTAYIAKSAGAVEYTDCTSVER